MAWHSVSGSVAVRRIWCIRIMDNCKYCGKGPLHDLRIVTLCADHTVCLNDYIPILDWNDSSLATMQDIIDQFSKLCFESESVQTIIIKSYLILIEWQKSTPNRRSQLLADYSDRLASVKCKVRGCKSTFRIDQWEKVLHSEVVKYQNAALAWKAKSLEGSQPLARRRNTGT